jgi:NAD-dependent dihydropyrimidine dehydrogenase PreA subunit
MRRWAGAVWRRRLIQGAVLSLFVWAAWLRPCDLRGAAVDGAWLPWLLRIDPLVGITAAMASRSWLVALVPAALSVVASFLVPRFFCGTICPMGSAIDLLDGGLKRCGVKAHKRKMPRGLSMMRFVILGVVLGSALAGVVLTAYVAPLVILNRTGTALLGCWPAMRLAAPVIPVELAWTYAGAILFGVAFVLCAGLTPRFWCRHLCPSGALLSVASRLGMRARRLVLGRGAGRATAGFSRREFIGVGTAGVAGLLCGRGEAGACGLVRPPGSVPETFFVSRCVGCGACIQACPTGVLQPTGAAGGVTGCWAPRAATTLSGCERSCAMCGAVCPTGAIRSLPLVEKQAARMGLAVIDRHACLAHAGREACRLCVEQCQASGHDAIEYIRLGVEMDADGRPDEESGRLAPQVVAARCTGCGQCEARCHQVNVVARGSLTESAIAVKTDTGMQDRLVAGSYIREPDPPPVLDEGDYLPEFLKDL